MSNLRVYQHRILDLADRSNSSRGHPIITSMHDCAIHVDGTAGQDMRTNQSGLCALWCAKYRFFIYI